LVVEAKEVTPPKTILRGRAMAAQDLGIDCEQPAAISEAVLYRDVANSLTGVLL
jgi:hypothetical protein